MKSLASAFAQGYSMWTRALWHWNGRNRTHSLPALAQRWHFEDLESSLARHRTFLIRQASQAPMVPCWLFPRLTAASCWASGSSGMVGTSDVLCVRLKALSIAAVGAMSREGRGHQILRGCRHDLHTMPLQEFQS